MILKIPEFIDVSIVRVNKAIEELYQVKQNLEYIKRKLNEKGVNI